LTGFSSIAQHLKDDPTFDEEGFLNGETVGPILAATSCKFKAPGEWPDTWIGGARIEEIKVFGFD